MTREFLLGFLCILGFSLITFLIFRLWAVPAHADGVSAPTRESVRPCSGAGRWFSVSAGQLKTEVQGFLDQAKTSTQPGKIVALICPHAGYAYSGAVAAESYKPVIGCTYETVVVIGLSHGVPIRKASVQAVDFYETPLGRVAVDKHAALALLEFSSEFEYSPRAHETEHSVENQIPFIQTVLPNAKIVPIVINGESLDIAEKTAEALFTVFNGKNVLFIASSDMSHFPTYDGANKADREALEVLKTLDLPTISTKFAEIEGKKISGLQCIFCGKGAVLTTLAVAKLMGGNAVEIIDYKNSGDISGDKSRVVGYGAVAIRKTSSTEGISAPSAAATQPTVTPSPSNEVKGASSSVVTEPIGLAGEEALLNDQQKARLLDIARKVVEAVAAKKPLPKISVDDPALKEPRGAFVTLKSQGELRGCIGRFEPDEPLFVIVQQMAKAAASEDYRFNPVASPELPDIQVEISALTPLKLIKGIDEIKVGRDGLYVVKGGRRGVLLPQVPIEQGWDLNQFLAGTCRKAGLPPDAYKSDCQLYTFSAEVFHEKP